MKLGPNVHGPGDWDEILAIEKVALEDDKVKTEIAKLGLPEGTAIVSDPWIYGRKHQVLATYMLTCLRL